MTFAGKTPRERIAFVDSDALQRICTCSSLKAVGVEYTSFENLHGLIDAACRGERFDAILLGGHANTARDVTLVPQVWDALGQRVRIFFLAHPSELAHVQEALARSAVDDFHAEVILSPAEDADLRAAFHSKGPRAHGIHPKRHSSE